MVSAIVQYLSGCKMLKHHMNNISYNFKLLLERKAKNVSSRSFPPNLSRTQRLCFSVEVNKLMYLASDRGAKASCTNKCSSLFF